VRAWLTDLDDGHQLARNVDHALGPHQFHRHDKLSGGAGAAQTELNQATFDDAPVSPPSK
jgi:hypothetical protein